MSRKGVTVQCSHSIDGIRCERWIIPGPPHTCEKWNDVRIWICRDCAELKIIRATRNSFRDSDEEQDKLTQGYWE